jgi:RsiW-degrading membrane proteinase PrsW (M82 family)
MELLLVAAILPIVALCSFVYKKDPNKEPKELLAKLFIFGFFSAIPVVIVELILGTIFPTSSASSFLQMFINVFVSVALVEEGFKWIISKKFGYDNKEFDEIYDIIVYTVFVSLGFACIENILYVLSNGLGNAIMRALTSIPGHTCFAIIMGYFFSKAKINEINKSDLKNKNIILSIIAPTVAHTLYDAFLLYASATEQYSYLGLFFISYIAMVVVCFITVNKVSKMQVNLNTSVQTGVIKLDDLGYVVPKAAPTIDKPVITNTISNDVSNDVSGENSNNSQPIEVTTQVNFCPICGKPSNGHNFCSSCGYKLK